MDTNTLIILLYLFSFVIAAGWALGYIYGYMKSNKKWSKDSFELNSKLSLMSAERDLLKKDFDEISIRYIRVNVECEQYAVSNQILMQRLAQVDPNIQAQIKKNNPPIPPKGEMN